MGHYRAWRGEPLPVNGSPAATAAVGAHPAGPRLVMDRENPVARGWSHVISPTDSLADLDALRRRIGAPVSALQLPKRGVRWTVSTRPHLDVCRGPRDRALALDGAAVQVFDSAKAMLRHLRALHARHALPPADADTLEMIAPPNC